MLSQLGGIFEALASKALLKALQLSWMYFSCSSRVIVNEITL